MTQININPTPVISMKISKKSSEISWFSEADIRSAQDKKNAKIKKDLKKKK